MFVTKRNGRKEPMQFDKITARISTLCKEIKPILDESVVDPIKITQKVAQGIFSGVTTAEIDQLAAETAAYMASTHPEFETLAARIAISNLQKLTLTQFVKTLMIMCDYVNPKTGLSGTVISKEVLNFAMKHEKEIEEAIDYTRDYKLSYQGFKVLERSYLLRLEGKIMERPQHMWMRVALGIHTKDIKAALNCYHGMSNLVYTHATPTLFNSGTGKPQMSSCFLLTMQSDSIEGIYDTLKQCAMISKSAGGIGISINKIRARGSYIAGSNGVSDGIVSMLGNFNSTARYVTQGGKRKGAFAIYLSPWHADIFDVLDLKKNTGKEEDRARDLFYGTWISDLFMRRAKANEMWSLFCPNEAPGLADVWGEAFEELYLDYEKKGLQRRQVKAQDVWFALLEAQIETGTPYIMFKDSCNRKSNQQNLGTIRGSNLCCEIIEYTSPEEVAVCNLASISLPKFLIYPPGRSTPVFNYSGLCKVVTEIVANLNCVIDGNYYPIPEARHSNLQHRPMGIGVQGLADVFILMRMPWESKEAKKLNRDIFETIYFAAIVASIEMAKKMGRTYDSYAGSPASKGKLQFDLWEKKHVTFSGVWNWDTCKKLLAEHGLYNSLLIAPMPTASTSRILGNNECFEPYHSNIYSQRVLSGDQLMINKHLMHDLIKLGIWNTTLRNQLIADNGSVQNIGVIPDELKRIYKTVWEIPQKCLIDMAVDRGPFICQSQSLNVFLANPSLGKLTSLHVYVWENGLKGSYYLRTQPAVQPIKFTVDQTTLSAAAVVKPPTANSKQEETEPPWDHCLRKKGIDDEDCLCCGS